MSLSDILLLVVEFAFIPQLKHVGFPAYLVKYILFYQQQQAIRRQPNDFPMDISAAGQNLSGDEMRRAFVFLLLFAITFFSASTML
jgi:hypothetical protein